MRVARGISEECLREQRDEDNMLGNCCASQNRVCLTDSHMIDGDRDGVDMSYGNVTVPPCNG